MSYHILANSIRGDGKAPIGITREDRSRHIFAIGQTGVGKSTFLRNLMLQDVASRGFSFFDPHGVDAEDLLDYIPAARIEETIYFNPQDTAYPVGFNLLGAQRGEADLVVSSVIESLRQAWPNSWGPRMEHILRNCFYALLEKPGSTILSVQRLLSDDDYRRAVTAKIKNTPVRHFWENEFASYDHRFKVQAIAPIQNKIGYIASNSLLRNILGQARSKFDLLEILDGGKIFIANLSGIGTKEADFLGSLLLTAFHLTALRRCAKEDAPLLPHHIYLEEVHRFSTPTLASMLSEIRKFGISLTMAQQFLDQNKYEEVQKALLGNAGTLAVFRVAPADGEVLCSALDPDIVKASALTSLSVGELYVRTTIEGKVLTQRSYVRPGGRAKRQGRGQSIINDSQRAWGTPREKIERRIVRIFSTAFK